MGAALGPLALALFQAGAPLGLANALVGVGLGGALLSGVARIALGVGLNFAANALLGPKSKPSSSQTETKQPVPPRSFSYGRVKVAGPLAFWEAKKLPAGGEDHRTLFKIVMLSSREIDAIEAVYLNDLPVTMDPVTDEVLTAPYIINGFRMARVTQHLGTDTQAADAMMLADWAGTWTSDHRLRGIAYIVGAFEQPLPVDEFSQVYPAGEPQISALIRGNKIYDPRLDSTVTGGSGAHRFANTATWEWSDNAALCALDYLTHEDGYNRPIARFDLASFMEMADVCDESVDLASGGHEARYRVATTVYFTEQRFQVLSRLLEACDGRIYRNAAGDYGIRGGRWDDPAVTLDHDLGQILGIEFAPPSALDRYNKLVIQFLSPPHGYVEQECDPWLDQADIDANGEKSQTLDLTQVPSYRQARRLAKIRMARENPEWIASAQTNFYGLDAIGEEAVTLDFSEMLIDGPFWLDGGPQVDENFTGAQLSLRSADATSYDWTTAEEGEAPTVPEDTSEFFVPSLDFSSARNSQYFGMVF